MDPRQYLAELEYSNEDITTMLADPKQAKLITAAAKTYGEGKSLSAAAAAEKAETATFWEQKTQELQGSVNRLTAAERRAAEAEGDSAKRKAYLKSLADQGYDVPKEMYDGAATTQDAPKYVTQEEMRNGMRSTAPDLVSLTALSNEYYALFGEPYVAVEEDFNAARAAGKGLRDYARSKYNFEGKRQEKANAKSEADYQKRYADDLAKERAKWAETNGSNPETRSPMPSKFDKLQKQEGFKADSWKSTEGRAANRAERLKKFENVTIN